MTLCTGSGSLPQHVYCFVERSFTEPSSWPADIQRQSEVWSCESAPDLEPHAFEIVKGAA